MRQSCSLAWSAGVCVVSVEVEGFGGGIWWSDRTHDWIGNWVVRRRDIFDWIDWELGRETFLIFFVGALKRERDVSRAHLPFQFVFLPACRLGHCDCDERHPRCPDPGDGPACD